MNNIEISFQNPWLLFVFPAALIAILLPFFLLPKKRRSGIKRLIPVILHVILAGMMSLCFAGMTLTVVNEEEHIVVLADVSDSMRYKLLAMTDYCRSLKENASPNQHIAVVTFGGTSLTASDFEEAIPEMYSATTELGYSTDISQALHYAADVLPAGSKSRMIILSDGKITEGNAVAEASAIREKGIRIDTVCIDTPVLIGEAEISDFTCPSNVFETAEFPVAVTVKSECKQACTLTIRDGGTTILRENLTIEKGTNVIRRRVQVVEATGQHLLSASIDTDLDNNPDNNIMTAFLESAERSEVLIITNTATESRLLSELLSEYADVTTVTESRAPTTLTSLLKYDETILINVSVFDLPQGFDEMADVYVREYGRTLITVGGTSTYLAGGMENTKLAGLLPVNVRGDAGAGNIALVIVMDVSSSMTNNNSPRLQMAKDGAKLSLDALTVGDYFGLITFSRQTTINVPLGAFSSKELIAQQIDRVNSSQGTYIYSALQQAKKILEKFETGASKHILLLSDGAPSDGYNLATYQNIVSQMYDSGITTSTVAIEPTTSGRGNSLNPRTLMTALANVGGGDYYEATEATALTSIMLEATEKAKIDPIVNENFVPTLSGDDLEVAGIEQDVIPELGGYVYTSLKNGATEVLSTTYITEEAEELNAPIYAYWTAGKGVVGSFLSDFNRSKWASDWANSEGGRAIISNIAKVRLPSTKAGSDMQVSIIPGGMHATIEVETPEFIEGSELSVRVSDGVDAPYSFRLAGDGQFFSSEIELESDRVYTFEFTEQYSESVIDSLSIIYVPGYSYEYDYFNTDGRSNLTSIAAAGGGELMMSVEELLRVEMPSLPFIYNPTILIMIITASVLAVDIIIRKLRIKDIKEFWHSLPFVGQINR